MRLLAARGASLEAGNERRAQGGASEQRQVEQMRLLLAHRASAKKRGERWVSRRLCPAQALGLQGADWGIAWDDPPCDNGG